MGFKIKNIKVENTLTTTIESHVKESFAEILNDKTLSLKDDLKTAWPVDTGRSKAGWSQQQKPDGYSVTNDVIAPDGEKYIVGLWMGSSRQMPDGGDIIYQRWLFELRSAINNMKID